jgi:hypothetical protein
MGFFFWLLPYKPQKHLNIGAFVVYKPKSKSHKGPTKQNAKNLQEFQRKQFNHY